MIRRIIFDLVLLGAIFYTPWWVAVPIALLGAFLFTSYYEIFAFGVFIDLLYGASATMLHGYLGIVGATVFYFVGEFARGLVRPL